MAHIQEDRIKETTTTTGTGNVTLAGAVAGFRAFSAVLANNDTCFYCIAHQTLDEWEVGLGTYVSATPALARTAVLSSSNAGSAVTFSAGTKDVFITQPAQRFLLPLQTADPTAPASGALLYARNMGGRRVPRFVGPSGRDSAIQPALWGNSVVMWLPGTGTTAAISFGVNWVVSATQAHPAIADTNVYTKIRRATYTTTTTAGNASGTRSGAAVVTRNTGFFFAARFGISTYHSAMQVQIGLSATSGALAGDPSAQNDSCGFGKLTAKTVWSYWTRDGSTSNTTDTGRTTAASGAADCFDAFMFCKPGDSKITFRLEDIATPAVLVDNVEVSSNLPTGSTILYAHAECRNVTGGAGVTAGIWLSKMYLETDN